MLKGILAALVALLLMSGVAQAADTDGDGFPNGKDACPHQRGWKLHDGCSHPYVVHMKVVKPQSTVFRKRHFTPEEQPTPSKIHKIENLEQARWGGPTLRNRVWCESGDRWWVGNGTYQGLLGIMRSWFRGYAWPRTPRGVRIRHITERHMPVYRVSVYDHGFRKRKQIRTRHQDVVRIKKGHLPENATPYDGWAALRVGQRAVSGDGPNASWECPL